MTMKRRATAFFWRRPAGQAPVPLTLFFLAAAVMVSCHSRQSSQGQPGGTEEQQLRDRIAALTLQEQLLTAEIALAKTPAPYLSIDMASRKVELKVQGHSLRSFVAVKLNRSSGEPFVTQIWTELEAKPFRAASRAKVVPGSGEATTSAVATKDPWGPKRMPADYDLICKEDKAVEIRSLPSEQSRSRITRWAVSGYRQLRNWTRDLLGQRNSYRESIEIWLAEDDARLLFWSLPKQFGILLINGS